MRKKFTFGLLMSFVIYYTFINNTNNVTVPRTWNSCANAGCHASSINTTTVDSIILLHPTTGAVMTGFYPDSTYRIRLVANNTSSTLLTKFGFQLRASVNDTAVGSFQSPPSKTAPTNNILTNSDTLSGPGGKFVLEALWKAPVNRSSVSLQSNVVAVNGNKLVSGDSVSNVRSVSYSVLGIVSNILCTNRIVIGTPTSGTNYTPGQLSIRVPVTGGNGGFQSGQTVTSTGVTGLTATLAARNFLNGNDTLVYVITGTAAGPGTANFALNIGLKSCSVSLTVAAPVGTITTLLCDSNRKIGTLTRSQVATGVSFKVLYLGGNTGTYPLQTVNSSGVTGLTATLAAGNFALGADSVTYTVAGTPTSVGNARFVLNIGGTSCDFLFPVNLIPGTITALNCVNGRLKGVLQSWKASVATDSFKVPYSGGNGGFHTGQIVNSTGVTGLTATLKSDSFKVGNDSLTYSISGTPIGAGNASFALNIGGKLCSFTANVLPPLDTVGTLDCPSATLNGTLTKAVSANSVSFTIPYTGGNAGSYFIDTVNSIGVTGLKAIRSNGILANGAGAVTYTVIGTPSDSGFASFNISLGTKTCNFSIRVNSGSIGAIDCNAGTTTGKAVAGAATSGLSFNIPYSGGNGESHSGQTVNSSTITGLTAVLSPGNFINGAGSLTYNVTGTPNAAGNAIFNVNIGGKTCTFIMNVLAGSIDTFKCNSGSTIGSLTAASVATGVSFTIPYSKGNGGSHNGQIVTSTGVSGLTATVVPGNFADGSGSITYVVTGTPSTFGTAEFLLNIGGKSCVYSISVATATAFIGALNCTSATTAGALTAKVPASGVSFTIPYTGGNNGAYAGQVINSTGATGLIATLAPGLLNTGNGTLTFIISDTADNAGIAEFVINLGGKNCIYTIPVKQFQGKIDSLVCVGIRTIGSLKGGVAANGVSFKVPYLGGNGGLYPAVSVTSTGITGYTASILADTFKIGTDSVTFAVVGNSLFGGLANFTFTINGRTCTHSIPVELPSANVSSIACPSVIVSGNFVRGDTVIGASFTVPYSGGNGGVYAAQSITSNGVLGLVATKSLDTLKRGDSTLRFMISGKPTGEGNATLSFQVGSQSCTVSIPVANPVAKIDTLLCDSIKLTKPEDPMAKLPVAGLSLRVPYKSTNGGTYPAISITSTGVTGLTATAAGGILNSSSGSIVLSISGTPASFGDAEFAISIGGKTCNYKVAVKPLFEGIINSLNCVNGTTNGNLIQGTAVNGTSFTVPYDGGNRGYYLEQNVVSTGVTGLTAKLNLGQFALGAGLLSYDISGTPSEEGTAYFLLNIGGKTCTYSIPVRSSTGQVLSLSCDKGQLSSSVIVGTLNPGVFFTIPYQGANGGPLTTQAIASTGVTGLTAQSAATVLNFGDGVLRYNLSGTTTSNGWANFNIQIGNKNCIYAVQVFPGSSSIISSSDKFEVFKYATKIQVNNHKENMNYFIYDMTGKNRSESVIKKTENAIDLVPLGLTSGTYFILLQGEKTSTSLKFTIE
jgi:hypothetical protein